VARPAQAADPCEHTADGGTLSLPLEARAAVDAVREALRATGYEVERTVGESRVVRTVPRQLAGDTVMSIEADVIPLALPEPASGIVLQATDSVPSHRVRDAPVPQRPGEANPLYGRLRAVADTPASLPLARALTRRHS
jgi:hypothetical protein